jgi:hypothetical protein
VCDTTVISVCVCCGFFSHFRQPLFLRIRSDCELCYRKHTALYSPTQAPHGQGAGGATAAQRVKRLKRIRVQHSLHDLVQT